MDEMRRLAYEDLDAALLMGLEMTAEDMAQRGNLHAPVLEWSSFTACNSSSSSCT